ncbi:PIR Superfamily Protein [Plasmodium ovale curtisi]|uniref:PIR Superfamily Protein n=2 Tax=Plasmodium ovale curtisi TaxID=864141 RepID=A0A1A8WPT7_PLAOA|nr:PIR Superfamily Protein [Plasmodium ovale curtisi]
MDYRQNHFNTRCNYLNYWVYLEIKHYTSEPTFEDVRHKVEDFIETLWESVAFQKNYICQRNGLDKKYEEIKIGKNEYSCEIRNDWINSKYIPFAMDNCKENSRIMENYLNQEKYILHISDNYSFYSMHKNFDYYPCNECKPKLKIGNIRECINEIDDDIESLKCSNSIGTSKSKISVLSTLISNSSATLAILLIIFILHKFSPLGSWLRKNILQMKKQKYIDQDTHVLLDAPSIICTQTKRTDDIILLTTQYDIHYHEILFNINIIST